MPGRPVLRILIAGGGTGGHIIPALAIANELRDKHQAEIRFIGTPRGLESRLVPQAGYPLELIAVGQLKNVSLRTRINTLFDLPRAILHCRRLLRDWQPAVVVGVGGYASGPAMMAAILSGIPTLAFEPNAAPGLANRIIGKRVSAAAVNFPPAAAHLPQRAGDRHPGAARIFCAGASTIRRRSHTCSSLAGARVRAP